MTPAAVSAAVRPGQEALLVQWEDGTQVEYASVWLRDNLPEDRDSFSGQRLIDVADFPRSPHPGCLGPRRARSDHLGGGIAGFKLCAGVAVRAFPRPGSCERAGRAPVARGRPARCAARLCREPLRSIAVDPHARLTWLTRLLADGIAFLSEVPCVESGIIDTMVHIGRIAETNYGLVFDVKAVPQPENLAYSDRGLGLHTDNPYREPVPGFQALHTLLAAPDGGDSLFADGSALAAELQRLDAGAFATLTCTPVPFRYRSQTADLAAERALIALDCSGAVAAVHYNSRSIAPLMLPAADCRAFYRAYRRFANLLRQPQFQLATRLGDGELVLFDNQRVLHGRTGFASARHPRHLRGCYLSRDSVYSQQALLQRQLAAGEAS